MLSPTLYRGHAWLPTPSRVEITPMRPLAPFPFVGFEETPLVTFCRGATEEIRATRVDYRGRWYIALSWWTQQREGEWSAKPQRHLTLTPDEVERLAWAVRSEWARYRASPRTCDAC